MPTYVDEIDTVALLVQVGDGGSPETFTHPCLINAQRGVKFSATAQVNKIRRCDDPTQPDITKRTVTDTDCSISGDGILPHSSAKTYTDWLLSGLPKNIKVQAGSAAGDLIVTGAFVLTSFDITGSDKGQVVKCAITLEQSDQLTSAAHA